ncbi:MAG TPA: hypothetical protein VLT89_10880 [Usitatibacter sp.]|nr:hypothetical protein [Usitatibacter sp.]
MLKKLRKSSRVTLVLIGVAAVAGCSGGDDTRRDVYASRDDCLADWNNKPEDCQPATQPSHAARGFWYGPTYYSSGGYTGGGHFFSGGSGTRSIGSTSASGHSSSISRGGFGSTAHSSSGG